MADVSLRAIRWITAEHPLPRTAVIDLRSASATPRIGDLVTIDGLRCRVLRVTQPRDDRAASPIIGLRVDLLTPGDNHLRRERELNRG